MQTIGSLAPEVASSWEHGRASDGSGTELAATGTSPSNPEKKILKDMRSIRERRNWLIHLLYVQQEYSNCLEVIEAQLRETEGTCEYALYVKGLLKRLEGSLYESLELIQAAVMVSPENAATRTQLGRALSLLGRHEEAIGAFEEAASIRSIKGLGADWEIPYSIALCHLHRRQYLRAIDSFMESLTIQRHDCTYLHLGKAALLAEKYETALQVYEEAVVVSPRNPDLLAMLGHLYLQQGDPGAAFEYLGRCLTINPAHVDALVAASSIIQDNGDYDVALTKYRTVVAQQPSCPQVWNNIGACFIGKKMTYAAIACLRKSIFLSPFDWISHYNLGVAYLMIGRYCSALQSLNAAVNLHANHAPSFMLIGICLGEMKDLPNACRAYERALAMQDDFLVYLNYAVTLYNSGAVREAEVKFRVFRSVWNSLEAEQRREQSSRIPAVVRELEDLLTSSLPLTVAPAVVPGDDKAIPDAPASASKPGSVVQ